MHSTDQSAWTTAALVHVLANSGSPEHQRAAQRVLRAAGVEVDELTDLDRQGVAAQAAAPLLQAANMMAGGPVSWTVQSDEALLAQGRASAQGAAAFAEFGLPMLSGLADALARPGARMLDVGTGVGALAVAYAEVFPSLTVVGLDVLPRVLALAADTVAASNVADRVELREQDVATLDEDGVYALAWLPAPFVPEAALRTGITRVTQALVPGGWLIVGHAKFAGDGFDDALTSFKTVAYGGTALDDERAQQLLREVGLTAVATMPTPSGSPAVTVGRKAAA